MTVGKAKKPIKDMRIGKWYWARSEEDLHLPRKAEGSYETREAAVEAALDFLKGKQLIFPAVPVAYQIFTGKAVRPTFSVPSLSGDIIEEVRDDFFYLSGEDDWLFNVPEEKLTGLDEEIRDAFNHWIRKHSLWPSWYEMEEVQEHEV